MIQIDSQLLDTQLHDISTMYTPTFTKKEAVQTGVELVKNLLESGTVDKMQFMANLCRLKEVVNSADTEMRKHLPQEKSNVWGVEFTPVNGGNTINYSEDEIYQQLKADLDARADLLKLAQSQTIIDAYGNDVPKVSTTPRKSSITIKF
jgi:hypothetical protein